MPKPISRRSFLKTLGAATPLALQGCAGMPDLLAGDTPPERPNIVLIMADDMGYSDPGCYGSEIATPHLDALAAGGVRFSSFYNAARCCPTRASLLTGLYPHQAGMGGMVSASGKTPKAGPRQGYLDEQCLTIAEVLKTSGYRTLMSGKWHVGEDRPHWPCDRGFDRYFGLISGAANYFDIRKGKRDGIKRQMALDSEPWTPPEDGFYMTDAISRRACEFLGGLAGDASPFFLYLSYTAPHWPLHAHRSDIERYRGRYMHGWDALRRERHARQLAMGLVEERWPLPPRDRAAKAWDAVDTKEEMDLKMAIYAAQVECMDRGIGAVVEGVRALGREENTLFLFLSDNGGCAEGGPWGLDFRKNGIPPGGVDSYMSYGLSWAIASNTPFRRYKQWVHEGGIATPLIARWPAGIKARGAITHQVGHVIDIMATCRDLAGATPPGTRKDKPVKLIEGKSLAPILRGERREGHDVLYWEHLGNRAVRRGRWKLVARKKKSWELYDLEADRTELNDLAAARPERVAELEALYDEWALRCGVVKRK